MQHPGKVPKEYRGILASIKKKAKRRGVNIRFSIGASVHSDDYDIDGSGGYYLFGKEIAVAINRPIEIWMGVLLHESCHLDQDFDPKIPKEIKVKWYKAAEAYFDWLGGKKQMNSAQVDSVVGTVVEFEKDCEMRVVELIKKWNLPIDIVTYIKAANLYLYSHQLYKEYRSFDFPAEFYNNKEAMALSPSCFQKSYNKIPAKLRKALEKGKQ